MRGIRLIIAGLIICTVASCGPKKLTPATEVVYEGPLAGNADVTYVSARKAVERCVQTKICMGLGEMDYALPQIRGMSGGNVVRCGDSLKERFYTSDGFITVVQGETPISSRMSASTTGCISTRATWTPFTSRSIF